MPRKKVESEEGFPKRPSGAHWRKAKRERQRQDAQQSIETGEAWRPEPLKDSTKVHLWTVDVLAKELERVYEQPLTPSERRRAVAELGRAIGMLQVKADMERRMAELEDEVNTLRESLRKEREVVAAEKRRLRAVPIH
jgi:Mg2+ and Co2+ transporter CorA